MNHTLLVLLVVLVNLIVIYVFGKHFYTVEWRKSLFQKIPFNKFNDPAIVVLHKYHKGLVIGYDPKVDKFIFAFDKKTHHDSYFFINELYPTGYWFVYFFDKLVIKSKFLVLKLKGRI